MVTIVNVVGSGTTLFDAPFGRKKCTAVLVTELKTLLAEFAGALETVSQVPAQINSAYSTVLFVGICNTADDELFDQFRVVPFGKPPPAFKAMLVVMKAPTEPAPAAVFNPSVLPTNVIAPAAVSV